MGNECDSCLAGTQEYVKDMASSDSEEITAMKAGAVFKRPTASVMGISLGTESIHVQLTEDRAALLWKKDGSTGAPTVVSLATFERLTEHADKFGLTLHGPTSVREPLLDCKATSRVQYLVWTTGLKEILAEQNPEDERRSAITKDTNVRELRSTMAEKAERAVRFQQRDAQITAARKEADARKAKYMQEAGGLKYTAQAMAERGNREAER